MMGRAGWLALSVFVLTQLPREARASTLQWEGDPACRRELEVESQIESMVRRPFAHVDVADFRLRLTPAAGAGWRLELEILPRNGGEITTRVLDGATCAEVTDAAAVAIALSVGSPDEAAARDAIVAPRALPAASPSPPSRADRLPLPSKPVEAKTGRVAWGLSLGAALDSGATPKPVPGGDVRVSLRLERLRFELGGGVFASSTVREPNGAGARFQLAVLQALACAAPRARALTWLICGGYELGQLEAEGLDIRVARRSAQVWHAARAEGGVAWSLAADWSLAARAGGAWALSRPSFVLDSASAIHRPDALSVRAWLGLDIGL